MTQLTKQERKRIYKKLLTIVCADPRTNHGFCYYIADAVENMSRDVTELFGEYAFDGDFIAEHLPELLKIKPNDAPLYDYWFACNQQGWKTRINKLYNIIQKM